MIRPTVSRFTALLLAVLGAVASAEQPTIRLCADEWMPYNGATDPARPGYVVELARAVFEPKGYKVSYTTLPWEQALAAVRSGQMSGAIGTNTREANGMVLPAEKIGAPSLCLLTRAESQWRYDNLASLRSVKLGVIKDYSYWPDLDTYIARGANQRLVIASGEKPLDDLMQQLQAGSIDVVAESEPVLLWYLRSRGLERAQFRVVFKGEPDPIYLGFAPTEEGRRLAGLFDEGLRALRSSGQLGKLLRRYGLHDWQ